MLLFCREPVKSKSHLLTLPIVWPCRLLSVACHNQQATCVPRACLGFGSPCPLHLFAYAWAVHVWIQIADGEARRRRREGRYRQGLFIRLLGGAKAQWCCGGKGSIGRVHQCAVKLGILMCGQLIMMHWEITLWGKASDFSAYFNSQIWSLMRKDCIICEWWENLDFSWTEPYSIVRADRSAIQHE